MLCWATPGATVPIFLLLIGEDWVAAAEAFKQDLAVGLPLVQVLHVGFVGNASVSGDNGSVLINRPCKSQSTVALLDPLQYQSMALLTFAKSLGIDDDLMLLGCIVSVYQVNTTATRPHPTSPIRAKKTGPKTRDTARTRLD